MHYRDYYYLVNLVYIESTTIYLIMLYTKKNATTIT